MILVSLGSLALGCALGAAGMFWGLSGHYNHLLDSRHAIMALDQINVLSHIKADKTEELAKTMEENLLQWAIAVPNVIRDAHMSRQVLWGVQRYYEKQGGDIPEPLASLLATLPPRPLTSCEIKQNSLFQ